MGTGSYFEDQSNPQVMVKVGNEGDSGVIEISDMLFTVKGPTAGVILMEWNVHESSQGSGTRHFSFCIEGQRLTLTLNTSRYVGFAFSSWWCQRLRFADGKLSQVSRIHRTLCGSVLAFSRYLQVFRLLRECVGMGRRSVSQFHLMFVLI
jgi:hypothetical protein